MSSLDTFFATIKDGTWHNIDNLSNTLDISSLKLKELCKHLSDRGLIKYDENEQKIKIQPIWGLVLPKDEEPKPQKNTLANFIIPPNASIDIQQTHISNLSNVEIELTLRIENKITEIAINA